MLELERPETLVSRVVDAIRQEIDSGRFAPQSRLPSELELAQQLNVSRSVIREAVSQLKSDGVLISRRGSGSFISNTPSGTVFRLPALHGKRSDLEQLFEMRLWIESQSASIAAVRRTTDDLKSMRKALEAMDKHPQDLVKSATADVEFHHAIAAACKNEYFVAFLDFLGRQLAETRHKAWENSALMGKGAEPAQVEHLALYQAIKEGDSAAAERAATLHLTAAAQRLSILL
ncbi:FadR/GntR family transcriptional regulator [Serratia ureilytica]|uniref:FadR/GntR family transcriptional regulator n=1 Tax=Serratia ureilytica TaxID=300181 RepID=UPI001D18B7A8|nr:FadR/GntR family transcriptional regulator [Serratia ureilytica]MCC4104741.1 FadR family transcriptional regulator [Serratia ureilytica]